MNKSKPSLVQRSAAFFAVIFGMLTICAGAAHAGDRREEAIDLVRDASETVNYFAKDSAFSAMWSLADDAKAIVIIPEKLRAGFIIGGAAGDAVMLSRNDDGSWSQPTFFAIGSLSFGLQIGGEASEVVLLVMTDEGKDSLLTSSVKLGGDITLAAGPIGAGAKAQTTDVLAFSRSRGLYGGLSLEGALLKSRRKWNKAYYNADVSAAEIVIKGEVYNPRSAQLQTAVWHLANRNAPATMAPVILSPETDTGQQGPGEQVRLGAPLTGSNTNDNVEYEDDAIWGEPINREESDK